MRAKLRDVADYAGVSTATASLVLNGKADSIGADAQSRVRAAAEKLGYRPNALARGLRSQRTQTVGLLSDDVLTTPYAAAMVQGAQEAADELGYVLLLANIGDDPGRNEAAIASLLDRQIDAAIYATMYHRAVDVPTQLAAVDTVLLDAYPYEDEIGNGPWPSGRTPRHWSVVPDEFAGATAAVEYLIAAGHTRIGFVNETARPVAAQIRERAFRDALDRHGLTLDPHHLIEVYGSTHGAYPPVTELLRRSDRPTALFCFNDRIATGAYHACRELGLGVPEDLSVVGFDNQELIAEAVVPMLTTVQLPHYEMGRWAMEQVMSLLDRKATDAQETASDDGRGPRVQLMPCPLVERQSVASPSQ